MMDLWLHHLGEGLAPPWDWRICGRGLEDEVGGDFVGAIFESGHSGLESIANVCCLLKRRSPLRTSAAFRSAPKHEWVDMARNLIRASANSMGRGWDFYSDVGRLISCL
ncbi:hypothetical protein AVEN_267152-1 [Araneus ventricosus]|uniref:Uncharacterized protein n=1 Tax=Araneus ventricosus TaxID=182803 RepID=A0A4Y2NAX1_ARAVE|nr:hypothetical protein AVEN_267152-1 [Araneus ventricosus]